MCANAKILFPVSFLFSATCFAQPLQPTPELALVNVLVQNEQEAPQEGEVIHFVARKSAKTFKVTTGAEGRAQILLPKGDTYSVRYRSIGGENDYDDLELPAGGGLLTFDYTLMYSAPRIYVLNNVFFDTDKTALRPSSYPALDSLAELLQLKKKMKIEIAGHTDSEGDNGYNLKLSQGRAEAVRNYLLRKGVSPQRVKAVGYGESRPAATNDTPQGRQINRRTEVHVLD